MNAQKHLVGILGGMGPQAGVDMAAKLIASVEAASDQQHVPFVLFSMPGEVSDRTAFLLGKTAENPAFSIAAQLEKMAGLGVTVAVIACNTAHARPIFDVVLSTLREKGVDVPILNLVEETVAYLRREFPGVTRVGVLGTHGTYLAGMYDRALAEAGLETVLPSQAIREEAVHAAIYTPGFGIKSTAGVVSARARELVRSAITQLRELGAEAVILGCTELPLAIAETRYAGIPVLDPARIVARQLVDRICPGG